MVHASRSIHILAGAAVLAMPATLAARDRANYNRAPTPVHQPIVSRTDYSFDVAAGPDGLAPGEARRLSNWFEGMALGYGDTVTVDDLGGWQGGSEGVAQVLSHYGMLVSDAPAPVSAGHPAAGSVRVVVSRASARVPGCPDWSRGNYVEFEGANTSNYGCASAVNLAAMIADPQDLVEGERAGPATDSNVTVKAIKSYRDAKNTGDAGLPGGITTMSAAGGGK